METRIGAVDLAKLVFEIAIADSSWHIVERQRLSRAKFATFFVGQTPCRIVMEACGDRPRSWRLWQ